MRNQVGLSGYSVLYTFCYVVLCVFDPFYEFQSHVTSYVSSGCLCVPRNVSIQP